MMENSRIYGYIITAGIIISLVIAAVTGVAAYASLGVVWAWFFIFIAVVVHIRRSEVINKMSEDYAVHGSPAKSQIIYGAACDITMVILLMISGWHITAVLMLISMVLLHAMKNEARKAAHEGT